MLKVDARVIGALRLGAMTPHQLGLALHLPRSAVRGSLERLSHQGLVRERAAFKTPRSRGGPPPRVWELSDQWPDSAAQESKP